MRRRRMSVSLAIRSRQRRVTASFSLVPLALEPGETKPEGEKREVTDSSRAPRSAYALVPGLRPRTNGRPGFAGRAAVRERRRRWPQGSRGRAGEAGAFGDRARAGVSWHRLRSSLDATIAPRNPLYTLTSQDPPATFLRPAPTYPEERP